MPIVKARQPIVYTPPPIPRNQPPRRPMGQYVVGRGHRVITGYPQGAGGIRFDLPATLPQIAQTESLEARLDQGKVHFFRVKVNPDLAVPAPFMVLAEPPPPDAGSVTSFIMAVSPIITVSVTESIVAVAEDPQPDAGSVLSITGLQTFPVAPVLIVPLPFVVTNEPQPPDPGGVLLRSRFLEPPSVTPPVLAVTDNGDGSGGNATITNAALGSLNVILYAPWTGTAGPLAYWTQYGVTISGGGNVAIVGIQGSYVWLVTSFLNGQEFISELVYQPLTNQGLSSVLNTIEDQTVAALNAMNLNLNGVPVIAYKKKAARFLNDTDDTVHIVVSGEPVPDSSVMYAWPNSFKITYEVEVTISTLGQQDFVTNLPTYTLWRQQIRRLFSKPGVYARPVFDQNVKPGEMVDRSAFDGNNFDIQVMVLEVIAVEPGTP